MQLQNWETNTSSHFPLIVSETNDGNWSWEGNTLANNDYSSFQYYCVGYLRTVDCSQSSVFRPFILSSCMIMLFCLVLDSRWGCWLLCWLYDIFVLSWSNSWFLFLGLVCRSLWKKNCYASYYIRYIFSIIIT